MNANALRIGAAMVALVAAGDVMAWQKKTAPIMTEWSEQVTPENVLPEYPRPQMVRSEWINLNGVWEFEFVRGITNRIDCTEWKGADPAIFKKIEPGRKLPLEILVPFPIESALSGVMERAEYMKYRRSFRIPAAWRKGNRRVKLNFDAVDWKCDVYVNGKLQGGHEGGYDAFSFDITKDLVAGDNELIVSVYDPTDNGTQPVGKQRNEPEGYWYTANSGIWQTVWLEPVDAAGATSLKLIPHVTDGYLGVTVNAPDAQQTVELVALDAGKKVASAKGGVNSEIRLPIRNAKLWSPDSPFLYDLKVAVKQGGKTVDAIDSYFGMREVGKKLIDGVLRPVLNGEFVFQLGTLDQGYWPDGNLRAPTDEALKSDVVNHKKLGFNLIRKHIKVEPQRWFYWCDRIGILVWQDMPSMHTHATNPRDEKNRKSFHANAEEKKLFEGELKEMVDEHISSPSVVCWILFNEGWAIYDRKEVARLSDWLSAYDPSRWVNDSTGLPNEHSTGDVYDVHIYTGPSAGLSEPTCFAALGEFGGIGLNVKEHTWFPRGGWSYGEPNRDQQQLNTRYHRMQEELLNLMYFPGLCASMYTQISDVEGETNGIYTYDRKVCKFDEKAMRAAHDRVIEESKKLAKITSANGLSLAAPLVVKGGEKPAFAFAKSAEVKDPLVTSAIVEAKLAVPAAPDAEAGVAARVTDEGGYLFGIKGDGTIFIRGFGATFGESVPTVEKKTSLKGEVAFKVTAFGSFLALDAGGETVVLHNARCAYGRFGAFAKGAASTVSAFAISNPAHRMRWMHGPVKFIVTRDEKHRFVDENGKKRETPYVKIICDCNAKEMADCYWVFEPGLADKAGFSIRHMGHPTSYMTVMEDGTVQVVENDGTPDFAKRATWYKRPGHMKSEFYSFESAARPGEFMRTKDCIRLGKSEGDGGFKLDSTFEILDGWKD